MKMFGFHPKFKGEPLECSKRANDEITVIAFKCVKRGSWNTTWLPSYVARFSLFSLALINRASMNVLLGLFLEVGFLGDQKSKALGLSQDFGGLPR